MITIASIPIFNGNTWTTLLKNNTTGSTNKALFIYGIALHTVTDLFARSTYKPDGGYINHSLGADNKDYIKNRFDCARLMARKVISHIKNFD